MKLSLTLYDYIFKILKPSKMQRFKNQVFAPSKSEYRFNVQISTVYIYIYKYCSMYYIIGIETGTVVHVQIARLSKACQLYNAFAFKPLWDVVLRQERIMIGLTSRPFLVNSISVQLFPITQFHVLCDIGTNTCNAIRQKCRESILYKMEARIHFF